ncbi:tyrosinase family protein [Sorangium sp. So ce136]|uniref:tyrosinase family protein n=1 Tax=Sorangium sp. So ce136 TaxID=3133284 RepID=UPI003EFDD88D
MESAASGRTAAGLFVRREVYSLSPEGPEIEALRRGVAEMQRRSLVEPRDPTGWVYQASIHGAPGSENPRHGWNSCQHSNFFFLSWHRMYLYHFERILRSASGDPSFALPYWNYSAAGNSAIPAAFRAPGTPPNPLYVEERGQGVNQGFLLPPSAVTFASAFRLTNFSARPGTRVSFGGGVLRQPGQGDGRAGELERQPHDVIHGMIGGQRGWMSYVDTAARDPIFFLHHANIDRLWKRWLDQGGGRGYPLKDEDVWWRSSFEFFDENGSPAKLTGADITDTVLQLGYRYDDDPSALTASRLAGSTSAGAHGPELIATVYGTSSAPIELGATPVSVRVEMPSADVAELGMIASFVESPIVLSLEDISFERNPGVTYEVYLNLPEGTPPDHQSHYYVGNIGFFVERRPGHLHGPGAVDQAFDVTGNVRSLAERGEWKDAPPKVTFIMRGLIPPGGAENLSGAAMEMSLPGVVLVTIGRVVITTE